MKRGTTVLALAGAMIGLSLSASACNFYFSYETITAVLGTAGEIGIRVEKTHNSCVLSSMEPYELTGDRIQILARSDWKEVSKNVYEIWVTVSLSEVGEGRLTISKFCTKEGLEEASLPIRVTAPGDDGIWARAVSGIYPWDVRESEQLLIAHGDAEIREGQLRVGELAVSLDPVPDLLAESGGAVWLYALAGDEPTALLVAGEGFFYRYGGVGGTDEISN